ncbi:NisI/SpaI family lantibiotic immunity lipoprotein [Lachnospiraceae bacterium ZAX-1]
MKKIVSTMVVFLLCFGMSGCSLLENEIADRKSEREYCILNEKNATIFTYGGTEYVILADTVEGDSIGAWVGYIQKFAVIDKQGAVLELREIELSEFAASALPDGTAHVVQFFNIYEESGDGQGLIIDVDGSFHKAISKEQLDDSLAVISYKEWQDVSDGEWKISAGNCTNIVYNERVYQITDSTINESELDTFLGVIGTGKVFDSKTKLEISKSELGKIETLPGELSKQERTSWTYDTVFSIVNTDTNKFIAVEINNKYLRADLVE